MQKWEYSFLYRVTDTGKISDASTFEGQAAFAKSLDEIHDRINEILEPALSEGKEVVSHSVNLVGSLVVLTFVLRQPTS
jgi:hypothetical protein